MKVGCTANIQFKSFNVQQSVLKCFHDRSICVGADIVSLAFLESLSGSLKGDKDMMQVMLLKSGEQIAIRLHRPPLCIF